MMLQAGRGTRQLPGNRSPHRHEHSNLARRETKGKTADNCLILKLSEEKQKRKSQEK
jgi:hypothetical protein